MRIVVDLSGCVGVGNCEAVAPDLFEVTDHAELRLDVVPRELGSLAERAVVLYPSNALCVYEDKSPERRRPGYNATWSCTS
jgi:ferredoxin